MEILQSPNGFTKVILTRDPVTRAQQRVHIWDKPSADPDIHSDRWDITSVVVQGELMEEVFTVEDDPAGEYELLRQTGLDVDPPGFEFQRYVRAALRESHRRAAGDTYVRPYPQFHRVTAVTIPVVTYFETGPLVEDYPLVLRRRR
jgi:hypothetical protein